MSNPHVAQFIKAMSEIDRSKHRHEVFSDFCELAYCALAKLACPTEEGRDALEEQYMLVAKRYRNKDDVRRMPELLGLTMEALNQGGCDFLGSVAGELGALDAKLGQFFTPYHVSRLMAEINLGNAAKIIEENGFITVQEPAVGAGGMVLAVADVIEELGFDPAVHLWVEATELSRSTYYMGFVQIHARGVAGRIICGNSLSLETFTSAFTATAPMFVAQNGHPFAKQRAEHAASAEAAKIKEEQNIAQRAERIKALGGVQVTGPVEQLGLFDQI